MYLRSLGNPLGSLVTATGRTDFEFYWNCFALITMPLFVFIGAQYNVNGIAIGLSLFTLLAFYSCYTLLVVKMIYITFKSYLISILKFNIKNIMI